MMRIPIKALSSNKAWQGRRFKTPEYKQYERDFLLLMPKTPPVRGKIALSLHFYMKNDKMADIDNPIKLVQDILVKSGVIEDDRFIYELHVKKSHSDEEFIDIEISSL